MSLPTQAWADATLLTITYLRAQLAALSTVTYPELVGVSVHATLPQNRTLPVVLVSRVGGTLDATGITDSPRMYLECWADTAPHAATIAGLVRDVMRLIAGVQSGFVVNNPREVGGPVDLTDPDTATPRYVLTVQFDVRANAR